MEHPLEESRLLASLHAFVRDKDREQGAARPNMSLCNGVPDSRWGVAKRLCDIQ